ncbi:MAG: hypothetical protein JKY22_10755 [Flavobacteriaceae bacterium]|nr:hypothetical protein [Flavobacteriaceae bacterium]
MNTQNTFFSKKIQEIHAKPTGEIIHSSDTLFKLSSDDNLYQLHPFFESLQNELKNGTGIQSSLAFPCVQLEVQKKEIVCDITIKMERGFLAVLLFDYSEHYEHLHEAAQEKKTALLNEQKHELTIKYLEEKKAYLDFMRARIDSKLIVEMEKIVARIDQLKKTKVSPEQEVLLQEIAESVGHFHPKAIQIREELDFDFNS